ncbi:MAG: rod shape-determining protein MreC [Ignavibacteriae bacterium]|nr:rod shape-determining protein MreC [Ignavibacteriota bacterium]
MYRIIEFIVRFKEYVSLSAVVVICFSLMTFGNVAQLGGFRSVVVGGIGWLQNAFSWIPNPVALKSENAALRELNYQLSDERAKIRQSLIENEKLRKLLEFKKQTTFPVVSADVVGKTTTEVRNYATLNKGAEDGIEEGMTVMTDAGIAGLIIAASKNYSLVRLLINRDSRVAAKIQRSRIDGILVWEDDQTMIMKNIPKSYDVKIGDDVITSAYSNRFPQNIMIGRVTDVRADSSSLFRKIIVTPAVNFSSLEQVFVVKMLPDKERVALEKEIEERWKSRNSQQR